MFVLGRFKTTKGILSNIHYYITDMFTRKTSTILIENFQSAFTHSTEKLTPVHLTTKLEIDRFPPHNLRKNWRSTGSTKRPNRNKARIEVRPKYDSTWPLVTHFGFNYIWKRKQIQMFTARTIFSYLPRYNFCVLIVRGYIARCY